MAGNGNLPAPLVDAVERLAGLPGLGPKSAMRAALAILGWPEDRARGLGQALLELRDRLRLCSRCKGLADCDPCPTCADPERLDDVLCVVGEWDSALALEEARVFRGRYLVLGGLLAPLDGMTPDKLELAALRERLAEGGVREVVLALGATLEGESTASLIKNMLGRDFPGIAVSRLAQGIPLGSEVKHMDKETLRQSMEYRQRL